MKPNTKYVAPDGYQIAMYPNPVMNITQSINGSYSHMGTNALDDAQENTGKSNGYAPCDMVCVAINPSDGEAIWWRSVEKVHTVKYGLTHIYCMILHDDTRNATPGWVVKQGDQLFTEGTAGQATGNHNHLEFGVGDFQGQYVKNQYGVWMMPGNLDPSDILFGDDTKIMNGGGLIWEKIPDSLKAKPSTKLTLIPEHRIARVKDGHNINVRKDSPTGTIVRTAPTGTKVEYTEKCVTNGHRYVSWMENGSRMFMAVTPTEEQANHWVDILPVPTKPSTSTSLPETTVTPSTHDGFIDAIAKAVQYYAPKYGISVCSPIIAQAILESAWGTSTKAKHHNYFGLKYREGRVACNSGTFVDGSQEQLNSGQYIPITAQWYEFKTLESGVEGYFQFINIANYSSLKGETDPHKYLEKIKAAGYATSQAYVENVWAVVTANNLTRFDNQKTQEVKPVNSPLATYTNITGNNSGKRTQRITKITPHYMAASWSGRQCADYFVSCYHNGRSASSNYCVGINGDIAVSVPEDCRAWTSSSEWNDQRAVTIECGNNPDSSLPDACYKSLVKLCADICKRNNINPHWDGTQNGTITVHRQFSSTSCPGNWLYSKITSGQFERDIKKEMGQTTTNTSPSKPSTSNTTLYRVRKSWSDAKSQIGAYSVLDNAKKSCPKGYNVYDSNGKVVYSNAETWDINGKVLPGSIVKSKSLAIKGVIGEDAIVPELVPLKPYQFPMILLSEASDSKDGAVDNYLATTDARVYLDPVEVTEIDIPNNRCKVKGSNVWISSVPLYVKK